MLIQCKLSLQLKKNCAKMKFKGFKIQLHPHSILSRPPTPTPSKNHNFDTIIQCVSPLLRMRLHPVSTFALRLLLWGGCVWVWNIWEQHSPWVLNKLLDLD